MCLSIDSALSCDYKRITTKLNLYKYCFSRNVKVFGIKFLNRSICSQDCISFKLNSIKTAFFGFSQVSCWCRCCQEKSALSFCSAKVHKHVPLWRHLLQSQHSSPHSPRATAFMPTCQATCCKLFRHLILSGKQEIENLKGARDFLVHSLRV